MTDPTETAADRPVAEPARRATWSKALRLVAYVLALVLLPAVVTLSITLLVPEGNDYARVTVSKHDRLEASQGPKIVFVGGSNLAYGLDSAMVEAATKRHVTNMGMNGYFGTRFMLAEVKPYVRAGDVVVFATEYDSFVKSADGTPAELLMAIKARPSSFEYLSAAQQIALLKALPYVAQQKVFRLIREGGRDLGDLARGRSRDDPDAEMDRIETFAGFNRYGDLTAHLDRPWPHPLGSGYDLRNMALDESVLEDLVQSSRELRAKGVIVIVSFTPLARSFYELHKGAVEALRLRLEREGLLVPSPPERFVFPDELFFDTVYHLRGPGRAERTRRVIGDIEAQLEKG